ncbi:MAG: glycosyltransferase family 4 protein [Phycisphaerales bacterium JB063]
MKIAYLNGQYPRATDTFVQREVAGLRSQGIDVRTYSVRSTTLDAGGAESTRQEQANTFYLLSQGFLRLLWWSMLEGLRSPIAMWRAKRLAWATKQPGLKGLLYQAVYLIEAAALARQMRKERVDHLHNQFADASCTVAMLASALSGVPFSFTIHGPGIFFEPMRWRLDVKARRAAFVSCISHFCRSQVMCFASPEDWDKLKIVHCGVEPDLFEQRAHTGAGKELLFVGRLDAVKGLPVLLEVLSRLRGKWPEVRLTVVGDGPDRARLESRCREADLAGAVTFVGFRTPDQVREHLSSTDVFVMTSFAEGVPVVLMEAMMAGVPVVAPRIAGIAELVEDGVSGAMASPGDVAGVVEAINRLLGDDALRSRYGQAGSAKVAAEFDITEETRKLASHLRSCSGGAAQPAARGADASSAEVTPTHAEQA